MSTVAPQKLPIAAELEKTFTHVNDGLFAGKLRMPPFVIQVEKKVVLRYVLESFHIVIGADFSTARRLALQESLLHEMCHVHNHQREIVDCTSNQYHNQKFLKIALNVGFFVSRHKTQGWGVTSFTRPSVVSCWACGTEFVTKRDSCPECNAELQIEEPTGIICKQRTKTFKGFELKESIWKGAKQRILIQVKGNSRKICFLKYQCKCPGPHNSFRTGRRPDGDNAIFARCEFCGELFECVESEYLERKNDGLVTA